MIFSIAHGECISACARLLQAIRVTADRQTYAQICPYETDSL